MNRYLFWFLRLLAKIHLYKLYFLGRLPTFVTITGSLGKTSTKNATYTVLNSKHKTRKMYFNSQIGLPLSILNIDEETKKSRAKTLLKAMSTILFDYTKYDFEIQELGISQKSDMDNHLKYVFPYDYTILTNIDDCHTENLGSRDGIALEKTKLTNNTRKYQILNADNYHVMKHTKLKGPEFSFFVTEKEYTEREDLKGYENNVLKVLDVQSNYGHFNAKLQFRGEQQEININTEDSYISKPYAMNFAQAVLVGVLSGISFKDSCLALANYEMPAKRNRILKGKYNSLILDDSYAASFSSICQALDNLRQISKDLNRECTVFIGDIWDVDPKLYHRYQEIKEKCLGFPETTRFVLLGNKTLEIISPEVKEKFKNVKCYENTEQINLEECDLINRVVLIKAAYQFYLDKIKNQYIDKQ